MENKIVVSPDLTLDWNKYHKTMTEINRQIGTGTLTLDHLQAVIEHRNPFIVPGWMVEMLNRERSYHKTFFGMEFDLTPFIETVRSYGRKKINIWRKLGLEVHYFPKALMTSDANFPGWKVKPEKWFYNQLTAGKLFRLQPNGDLIVSNPALSLERITVLIDTRCKPAYSNGVQMYENDNLLGVIIKQLREQGKIEKYSSGTQDSRFGVSSNEWQEQVKPSVAQKLGLNIHQVRLERVIESNVIPQLYSDMPRKDDGTTSTSVWYEEFLEGRGRRLYGGHSGDGGLARVSYNDSRDHWGDYAVRFLAVL